MGNRKEGEKETDRKRQKEREERKKMHRELMDVQYN